MRLHLAGMTIALLTAVGSSGASAQGVIKLAQAAAAPGTTPAAQKLVGVAAWGHLVGNSITGKEDGETLVEYYAPDGTAKSMLGNEISTGQWALVDDTFFFKYADE